MFKFVTKTWNPVIGCKHYCSYCWARSLAETKLKNIERYKDGFIYPKLIESELNKKFGNELIFVVDMGDLFGNFIPTEWIMKVIEAEKKSPDAIFFHLTKNPKRYFEFVDYFPKNAILGATIETNRLYPFSKAPEVKERYDAMKWMDWKAKHISIEPIMDFDFDIFLKWIHEIKPTEISIGYDNYNSKLPEPSLDKVKQLISQMEGFTNVNLKSLREAKTW